MNTFLNTRPCNVFLEKPTHSNTLVFTDPYDHVIWAFTNIIAWDNMYRWIKVSFNIDTHVFIEFILRSLIIEGTINIIWCQTIIRIYNFISRPSIPVYSFLAITHAVSVKWALSHNSYAHSR